MEHNLTDVIVQRCSLTTSLIHVYENHNDCIFMNINENIVSMVTNNIKEISLLNRWSPKVLFGGFCPFDTLSTDKEHNAHVRLITIIMYISLSPRMVTQGPTTRDHTSGRHQRTRRAFGWISRQNNRCQRARSYYILLRKRHHGTSVLYWDFR